MSRLDSFIRRLQAQRTCLNWAAAQVDGRLGPVLELGLGNGRTYDHLRQLLPEREIFVFEREVNAHPDCRPDVDHLFLGDVRSTLLAARADLPAPAVLAHSDLGTGDARLNARLAEAIARELPALLAEDALVLTDQPFLGPELHLQPLPPGVPEGRYFIYRVARNSTGGSTAP